MAPARALAVVLSLSGTAWAMGGERVSDPWIAALMLSLLSGAGCLIIFRNLRRARAMEDTPTSKIASAAQGEVEIVGRAVPPARGGVVSPLTGTPCVWYSFQVERHDGYGRNSRWVSVSHGRSHELFGVRDETDLALVHPAGAEVTPRTRHVWRGNSPLPLPPYYRRSFFGSHRYTEELIVDGEPVTVLGWFQTVRGDVSRSVDVRERLRRVKEDPQKLLERFDTDRDGTISVEEWDAARAVIEEEARREFLSTPSAPAHHWVGKPRESDLPFLISSVPERDLAARYRRRAAVGMAVFLGCGAGAVALAVKALGG